MNRVSPHLPLPINHAFYDSPVGKREAPRVRSLAPTARRTPIDKVGHAIYKMANRVFNVLVSKDRRTDVEYRDSLKRTSHQVGALVGAIHDGRLTGPGALEKAFERIKNTAEPVTRRGVNLPELLAQRFEVHLNRLTDKELKTLQTNLAVLRVGDNDPHVAQHLDQLHACVRREAGRRVFAAGQTELLPRLKQAIGDARDNPALAADTFASLGGITKSIMARCGLSLTAKYKDETLLAQAVIRKVINDLLTSGQVSASEFKTLLAVLPSESLAELQPSVNAHLAVQDVDVMELLVEDAALHRQRAAQEGFDAAVEAVKAGLPTEAGQAVPADTLRHLIDVGSQWKALQKHAAAFDVPANQRNDDALKALRKGLNQLTIDASSLKPLKDHELSALVKALDVLSIQDGKEQIEQTMTMRLESSRQKVSEALPGAISLLLPAKAGQAPQALMEFEQVVARAKARSDALQGLTQTGGDDMRTFEFDTYGPVFKAMDATQLKTCQQALSSTFSLQLIETLKAMGSELCTAGGGVEEDPRSVTGSRLLAMGQVLLGLLGEAGAESARRANPDNPPAYEVPDIDTTRQDPAIRDAVRQLFPIPQ
jgi:hypothetical protein